MLRSVSKYMVWLRSSLMPLHLKVLVLPTSAQWLSASSRLVVVGMDGKSGQCVM